MPNPAVIRLCMYFGGLKFTVMHKRFVLIVSVPLSTDFFATTRSIWASIWPFSHSTRARGMQDWYISPFQRWLFILWSWRSRWHYFEVWKLWKLQKSQQNWIELKLYFPPPFLDGSRAQFSKPHRAPTSFDAWIIIALFLKIRAHCTLVSVQ